MSLLDALLLDPAPLAIWVAARTDGIKGSGTASDPYNGSTQASFDATMNLFASQSNVTIHLGPGTFPTAGFGGAGGWQARPGMKILGSGIDVTMLTLMAGTSAVHYFAIGHSLSTAADTFEVCDLTIDSNLGASGVTGACGGVRVMGNHALIRRVKVKNWGTKSGTVQCFALSVITAYPDTGPADVVNAGMEACMVVEPHSGSTGVATALNVGSQNDISYTKEGHAKSPYIRNCFVDCGVATPNPDPAVGKFRGISMGWCRGGVVEGNHVYNCDIGGPYQDQRSIRDLIVRNNFLKNVARGPFLNLGQVGSTLGSGTLTRSGTVGTITGIAVANLAVGDRVRLVTSPGDYTGVYVVRTISQSPDQFTVTVPNAGQSSVSVTSAQRILSVARAIIEGNLIELAPGVTGVRAIEVEDNNGTNLYAEPPDYFHGDGIIRNNKIRYVDGASPSDSGATLVRVRGANHPIVKDNILDTLESHSIATNRCGSATCFNNHTPRTTLLLGWNADTSRSYDELETEAEDALVLSLLES